jgi:hypothetical protein
MINPTQAKNQALILKGFQKLQAEANVEKGIDRTLKTRFGDGHAVISLENYRRFSSSQTVNKILRKYVNNGWKILVAKNTALFLPADSPLEEEMEILKKFEVRDWEVISSEKPVDPPSQLIDGIGLISIERTRQMTEEGWTPEHGNNHKHGELGVAAACYAGLSGRYVTAPKSSVSAPFSWPWKKKWWKPSDDSIKNLVRAGALIAAEIDRIQRLPPNEATVAPSPTPVSSQPVRNYAEVPTVDRGPRPAEVTLAEWSTTQNEK